jgi:hypothetical protein
MMKQTVIAHVERYIDTHKGQIVYVDDLEQFIMGQNNTNTVRRASIQNAMKILIRTGAVETLRLGRSWKITKPTDTQGKIPENTSVANATTYFEKVGELTDGSVLLKCENGKFYRGVPL